MNTDDQLQIPADPTSEEVAAQEEAERLERERIAKENAIESAMTNVINEYAFDDTGLNDEQKKSLDNIAEVLNNYSDLSLQIKGHTCNIGYKSVNERVGLRRADTAKAYLVEKGISAERISTITGGESEPIVENNSCENRKQNRRLSFTILQ
ncbi:MAG: OmpA family protein [Bacteroidaceae bacterium]|nr:OmpA family protein [Bacteroidaceae bacterium]